MQSNLKSLLSGLFDCPLALRALKNKLEISRREMKQILQEALDNDGTANVIDATPPPPMYKFQQISCCPL